MIKGIKYFTEFTLASFVSSIDRLKEYTGIGYSYDTEIKRTYFGEYKDGKEHGFGYYIKPGARCLGEFENGNVTGLGIKQWGLGHIYAGQYVKNKKHGWGIYRWQNGATAIGEFNNNNAQGFGVFLHVDGYKYIGDIHYYPTGNGKWYDEDNNEIDITSLGYLQNGTKTYSSNFKVLNKKILAQLYPIIDMNELSFFDSKEPGYNFYDGKYDNKSNRHIFLNKKLKGVLGFVYPDGQIYEGEIANGNRNGWGYHEYPGSMKQFGLWKNRLAESIGVAIWNFMPKKYNEAYRALYIGEWKGGQLIGHVIKVIFAESEKDGSYNIFPEPEFVHLESSKSGDMIPMDANNPKYGDVSMLESLPQIVLDFINRNRKLL